MTAQYQNTVHHVNICHDRVTFFVHVIHLNAFTRGSSASYIQQGEAPLTPNRNLKIKLHAPERRVPQHAIIHRILGTGTAAHQFLLLLTPAAAIYYRCPYTAYAAAHTAARGRSKTSTISSVTLRSLETRAWITVSKLPAFLDTSKSPGCFPRQ